MDTKSTYDLHVKLNRAARATLKDLDNQALADIMGAYGQLMRPEQEEMTIATDVLAMMAMLASKTVAQELMLRARGK